MFILGLTGSIGMGKSTLAAMARSLDIPVYDADAQIHHLYDVDPVVIQQVAALIPESLEQGKINRRTVANYIQKNPEKLKILQEILYPRLHLREQDFLNTHKDAPLILLDIPLLFETGADKRVNAVLVVTAPEHIQRERVLQRDGTTEERFNLLLSRQLPDEEKRQRADYLIDTSQGHDLTFQALMDIIKSIRLNHT